MRLVLVLVAATVLAGCLNTRLPGGVTTDALQALNKRYSTVEIKFRSAGLAGHALYADCRPKWLAFNSPPGGQTTAEYDALDQCTRAMESFARANNL